MTEKRNHIEHLTSEELAGYLEGNVDGKQANRIERHLSGCPLCSEALEGLQGVDPEAVEADLEQFSAEIQGKSRRGFSFTWPLRIAAGVILISISTLVVINYLQSTSDQEIATAESREDKLREEVEVFATPDSITESIAIADEEIPNTEESEVVAKVETQQSDSGAGPSRDAFGDIAGIEAVSDEEAEDLIEEPIALSIPAEEKVEEISQEAEESLVLEEREVAEPVSKRSARSLREETVETAKGEAFLAQPEIEIIMLDDEGRINQNAVPVVGIENYKQEIVSNLAYPVDAASNQISGIVALHFSIDSEGKLSEFEIVEGLGHGCDEEAIRVIREGSEWKPAQGGTVEVKQKVEIRIPFPISRR